MVFRRLGIAGYMGAGKTTAARLLAERAAPALIIDADREAKTLMATDRAIRHKLIEAFGTSIIEKDQKVSFRTLGRIVFCSKKKLLRLNAIVHPPLVQRLRELLRQQVAGCCILDAAVLPLWKIESWFDACLWIHAAPGKRLERLHRMRSDLDERQLRDRMRMQEQTLPVPERSPWRRVVNEGSIESLADTLDRIVCIV
jgi:dephospho-CoA kinase